MIRNLISFFVLLPMVVSAQVSITGRVISQGDTKPVGDASVFISNATIGDRTGTKGVFRLNNIKPGKYDLVVSLIGFDSYKQSISVGDKDISLPDITIYPKTIALNEVKIKVNKDPDRQRNYDWFKEEFLGKSELAKECRILNPEMLDMDYDERQGILTASSVDFLIIENRALGYRMKYLLSNFTLNNYDEQNKSFSYAGSVLFEPLQGSSAEEKEWKEKRQEVYEGSQMHFLRSALNNRMEEDGFRVLRVSVTPNPQRPPDSIINENIRIYIILKDEKGKMNYKDSLSRWLKIAKQPAILRQKLGQIPVTKNEIINKGNKPGLFSLSTGNTDGLFITYNKYQHFSTGAYSHLSDASNTSSTIVSFNEPAAQFDNNGVIITPRSLSYEGAWSQNRVAMLLPLDYEPTEEYTTAIDSEVVKKINSKYNSYAATYVSEKAYLHFDKPYYTAGDTIYFKAYVTDGEQHRLTEKSGVLYADLIGPDNKMSRSITLQLTGGIAWGDFALADTLEKGNYRVRAYTNWMRNEGENAFFDQSLAVGALQGSPVAESGSSQPSGKTNPVTQFFPEGGNLVIGVHTKIAFKALAANGLGIDIKGVIIDENGKEFGSFSSSHLGMGCFYLTPEEKKTYSAKLTYSDGTQAIIQLPAAEAKGISMEVTAQVRSYTIRVSSSKAWYRENRDKIYTLIAYSAGKPYSISCKLDNPELQLTLSKKDLKAGIVKATLFSSDGEPLTERLFFVKNDDFDNLNLSSNKTIYGNREKVNIQLTTAGNVNGYYSASVTDESKVAIDGNTEPTIINNLLFTSELKGYIEQPNYYFIKPTDKTNADLDLVMLTHGYRRFDWKQVMSKNNPNSTDAFRPESGLQISGIVKHSSGKPFVGARVTLFNRSSSGTMLLDTLTDEGGRFVFDRLNFGDSTKFVIQARVGKSKNDVVLSLDSTSVPRVSAVAVYLDGAVMGGKPMAEHPQVKKQLYEEQKKYSINKHQVMLKEVVIKQKKLDPSLAHSENLNGAGNADQVFTSKELENTSYTLLKDFLAAHSPDLEISYDHFLYSRRSVPDFAGNRDFMEIIVDGIPMQQKDLTDPPNSPKPIDWLETGDIESIEIGFGAHYGAIYGSRAAGGVLIITTKRGKQRKYERYTPGVKTYTVNGFYKAREFYSPRYDNPLNNSKTPDLRSTIYWNPNIITDKDGRASFSFFNADGKGTYRVVIEGIDADGNLGRQVYRYKVE